MLLPAGAYWESPGGTRHSRGIAVVREEGFRSDNAADGPSWTGSQHTGVGRGVSIPETVQSRGAKEGGHVPSNTPFGGLSPQPDWSTIPSGGARVSSTGGIGGSSGRGSDENNNVECDRTGVGVDRGHFHRGDVYLRSTSRADGGPRAGSVGCSRGECVRRRADGLRWGGRGPAPM